MKRFLFAYKKDRLPSVAIEKARFAAEKSGDAIMGRI